MSLKEVEESDSQKGHDKKTNTKESISSSKNEKLDCFIVTHLKHCNFLLIRFIII